VLPQLYLRQERPLESVSESVSDSVEGINDSIKVSILTPASALLCRQRLIRLEDSVLALLRAAPLVE
jgi:hypothetical protein